MADSKISALAAVTDFLDTDEYVLARAGTSNKIAGADLRRMLKTYRKTTSKDVQNTNVETDLLNGEITIDAGAMGANGIVRATLLGDYLNNAAAEAVPKHSIKFGGTTLLVNPIATNSAPSQSSLRRPFYMQFDIHNLGATNSQYMAGIMMIGEPSPSSGQTGLGGFGASSATNGWTNGFSTNGTVAVDTTAACLLEVTVTWATGTTTRSWRLRSAHVQIL